MPSFPSRLSGLKKHLFLQLYDQDPKLNLEISLVHWNLSLQNRWA